MSWFVVDKKGLAKLLEKKGKVFVLFELIQNAWDTNTKTVVVKLTKMPGRPWAELEVVDDDPDGFADLSHAYTIFAESEKKNDPTKRGRFNLGEKLVLALCKEAEIRSTKGTVHFSEDGSRRQSATGTTTGSVFKAVIKMNEAEHEETCREILKLIPPPGVATTFNGTPLVAREPLAEFEAQLPTIVADEEGNLSRTTRKTTVRVHEVLPGEEASIYELGIHVVVTGDKYHVDVQQKVPVNLDRDNVPPAYLRTLRALVLNHLASTLDKTEAAATWVTDAIGHKDAAPEAITTVLDQRFGKQRAVYDPSDREANNRLVARGYTVISGGTFGSDAWANIKAADAVKPSGVLAPTPKPYSEDPNAPQVEVIPPEKWTEGMKAVVGLAKVLAMEVMGVSLSAKIVMTSNAFAACYGEGRLDLNLKRLGHSFFDNRKERLGEILDLLIHEFSHEYEANHLSENYFEALSRLGGKFAVLALAKPQLFAL